VRQLYWKNGTIAAATLAILLIGSAGRATDPPEIPYVSALQGADVVQEKMATELPGALILGNGDLNGILWVHEGRLRFSITKNDACDARLETADDPEITRIDIKNRKWSNTAFPPSWRKPYPCPMICGHVEFSGDAAGERSPSWAAVRQEGQSTIDYDKTGKMVIATIQGHAGNSAGWGFAPKATDQIQRVTARLSGNANAQWYLHFVGPDIASGWQPATEVASDVTFEIPAGSKLQRIDLYIWTNDGKPAEIRLHSVMTDGNAQSLAGAGTTTSLQSKLDLARAVGTVTGTDGMKVVGRVLAGRNAAVFESTGPVSLTPCAADFIPASKGGTRAGADWVLTEVPGDVDWPGMTFAIAHAAKSARHAVAVVTSLEADDPVDTAVRLANQTLAEDANVQIAAHEAAWRQFWATSGISLDDPYLEGVWYRNLYFLRCFSKPGVPPIGLFMGCATDVMPWHGVATTDYNFEQCFWPAYVCNHAELAEPYNRFMVDYLPRGKWFAKETYGINGAFYPVNHFNHQINDPAVCKSKNRHMNFYFPWTYVPGANGWQAQNVWLAYLYHPDRQFLETDAYPIVKEMAIFYAEFLQQCERTPQGKAIYGPTYSPEHRGFGENDTPCDIAFTRFTLKAALQGAETLGCDAELVKKWQAALAIVPDYSIVPDSDPPIVSDVRGGQPITYNVAVPVLPVFPVGEVTWWSPEDEKKLFADTIETLSWTGYNSTMIMAGARARLSMPGTHEWITNVFQQRQMPSGFFVMLGGGYGHDARGNYSEQVAAAGIVGEMLMQSVGGIVRLFPAWPSDKDAHFQRLLAEGGFEISASQVGGQVTQLQIDSTAGGQLRLFSPWPLITVHRDGVSETLKLDDRGIVELTTQPGDSAQFTPGETEMK
jgi:hypothetical protein